MKHEIHIPAHSALWITDVLAEIDAFISNPDATTELHTFKAREAIKTLRRAFMPLEHGIRAEVQRLSAIERQRIEEWV